MCSDACGITPDPGCPIWQEPEYPRGSQEWLLRCTPVQRREYALGCDLARLLKANADILVPVLMELLRDEMLDMVRHLIVEELGPLLMKKRRR